MSTNEASDDSEEQVLKTCPDCEGRGDVACDECGGTGEDEVCEDCNGSGVDDDDNECDECGGTGYYECGTDGCGSMGTGRLECETCGGQGEIEA